MHEQRCRFALFPTVEGVAHVGIDAETALNSKSLHKLSYRLYVSDGVRVVSVGI